MGLADRGAVELGAVARGDVVERSRRREIGNERARTFGEDIVGRQRQRPFFADGPACFVHDGKPIGVGIERKPEMRPEVANGATELLEVFGQRLRAAFEFAVLILMDDSRLDA